MLGGAESPSYPLPAVYLPQRHQEPKAQVRPWCLPCSFSDSKLGDALCTPAKGGHCLGIPAPRSLETRVLALHHPIPTYLYPICINEYLKECYPNWKQADGF